jgi:hypothetical protein
MAVCWLSARTCNLLPRFCRGRALARLFVLARHRFSFSRHSPLFFVLSPLATALHSRWSAMCADGLPLAGIAELGKLLRNVPSVPGVQKSDLKLHARRLFGFGLLYFGTATQAILCSSDSSTLFGLAVITHFLFSLSYQPMP